jgi:two-component system response regulator
MTNQSPVITILTAEDDAEYRLLLQEAFKSCLQENPVYFVDDGIDLLQFLHRQGKYANSKNTPRPDLILLDLNMPHKDGRSTLVELKADPELRGIPVVVLTVSEAEEDILETYNHGGAGYIIKPQTFEELVEVIKGITQYWFDIVELINGESLINVHHRHHPLPYTPEAI